MPRRSYDHYCAIAGALDRLGERWTLLIARELLAAPRRYSDLLADLPGISTDILAARLREMETDGLVVRRPHGVRTYELTEVGAAAAPVLHALADWGVHHLQARRSGDALRAHWLGKPFARWLERLSLDRLGVDRTVELRVDEATFHVLLKSGLAEYADGPAAAPDVLITTDAETAAAIVSGRASLHAAQEAGAVRVDGDPALLATILAVAQRSDTRLPDHPTPR